MFSSSTSANAALFNTLGILLRWMTVNLLQDASQPLWTIKKNILNYYSRCIPLEAQHQVPFNELLREPRKNDRRKFPWTPAAESAFENHKTSLTQAALLSHLYPNAPLALVTDASKIAIGASLEQKCGDHWKPLRFFSRKLTSTETRCCTYNQKLLAIYAAILPIYVER
jgi:hypothetical protein